MANTSAANADSKSDLVTAETFHRTIGDRAITRGVRTCRETGTTYFAYSADPDIAKGETYGEHLGGESPDHRFARFEQTIGGVQPFDLREADPLGGELKSLAVAYPKIAEMLGKGHKRPEKALKPGLFDTGPVSVVLSVLHKLRPSRDEILEALQKHVGGDLGVRGKVEPGRPREDDLFMPIGLPPARQAAVAIFENRGIVRSRHILWSAADVATSEALRATGGMFAPQYHRTPETFLEVITLLSGNKSRTIVSGSSNSNPF